MARDGGEGALDPAGVDQDQDTINDALNEGLEQSNRAGEPRAATRGQHDREA